MSTSSLRAAIHLAITTMPLLSACKTSAPPGTTATATSETTAPTTPTTASSSASPPAPVTVFDPRPDQETKNACMNTHTSVVATAAAKPFAKGAETALGCASSLTLDAAGPLHLATDSDFGTLRAIELDERCTTAHQRATPGACAYVARIDYPKEGRPAVQDGVALLAPIEPTARWRRGRAPTTAGLDASTRRRHAREWTAAARAEHASIASFARATLELMEVAAPPSLLEACARAALDEVKHAELSFTLASAYAGESIDPGPLPRLTPRGGGLIAVARDTFLEGCVAETTAVLHAERALAMETDPVVREVLAEIVADETRHAELAWQTIAWAISVGGDAVLEAVRAAAEEVARTTPDDAWREVIAPSLASIDPAAHVLGDGSHGCCDTAGKACDA